MTRQCRYCGQWHYDMDCKKRPESYQISMSLDQWPPHEEPQALLDSGSDSDESFDLSSSNASYVNQLHATAVYSNGQHAIPTQTDIKIPRAERYQIQISALIVIIWVTNWRFIVDFRVVNFIHHIIGSLFHNL